MKFIADDMLGRLAKWMRVMGCDVEYFKKISDQELAERAYESGRIILTRDTLLIRRKKVRDNYFFIHGDSYKKQIRQVVERFSIDPYAMFLTRCLICNVPLNDIEKGTIKNKAPGYVYETEDSFKICPSCNKVFWHGTHKDNMLREVKEALTG